MTQAKAAAKAISGDLARFKLHDVVVSSERVGSALAVLVKVCCQPIIPERLVRLLTEFPTGWRSLSCL